MELEPIQKNSGIYLISFFLMFFLYIPGIIYMSYASGKRQKTIISNNEIIRQYGSKAKQSDTPLKKGYQYQTEEIIIKPNPWMIGFGLLILIICVLILIYL